MAEPTTKPLATNSTRDSIPAQGTESAWTKTKTRCLPTPYDRIVPGDQIVDLHYSDWREMLRISEPYRIISVLKRTINTSPALVEFAQLHQTSYINKMLMVIDKGENGRSLGCMACYDAAWTYVVEIEVEQ